MTKTTKNMREWNIKQLIFVISDLRCCGKSKGKIDECQTLEGASTILILF